GLSAMDNAVNLALARFPVRLDQNVRPLAAMPDKPRTTLASLLRPRHQADLLGKVVAFYRRMATNEPTEIGHQHRLARVSVYLSISLWALRQAGPRQEAERLCLETEELYDRLISKDPESQKLRVEVGEFYRFAGSTAEKDGLSWLKKAIAILEPVVQKGG